MSGSLPESIRSTHGPRSLSSHGTTCGGFRCGLRSAARYQATVAARVSSRGAPPITNGNSRNPVALNVSRPLSPRPFPVRAISTLASTSRLRRSTCLRWRRGPAGVPAAPQSRRGRPLRDLEPGASFLNEASAMERDSGSLDILPVTIHCNRPDDAPGLHRARDVEVDRPSAHKTSVNFELGEIMHDHLRGPGLRRVP